MQYNKLIKQCIKIIKQSRTYNQKVPIVFNHEILEIQSIENVYVELFVHTKIRKIKVQQWSFIKNKHLLKSINCQDDDDPQVMGQICIKQQQLQLLENISRNINPKTIFKVMNSTHIEIVIKDNQDQLILFDGHNTFLLDVCEYQGLNYECKVHLKYNYEYQNEELEQCDEDSQLKQSWQFELLNDIEYQQNKNIQIRKLSESGIGINNNLNISSPQIKKINHDHDQIIKLFNNVNFKSIQSSTLKVFLSRHQNKSINNSIINI